MPAYCTDEYRHLLAAERVISKILENPGEDDNVPMLARALVDVIQQKRFCRGVPNPKPAEGKPKRGPRQPRNVVPVEMPAEPPPAQSQG